MRILFIIVGFMSLLLAGLVVFEIRTTRLLSSQIQEVQDNFSSMDKALAVARNRAPNLGDRCLGDLLDEADTVQRGWFAVAVCGGVMLLVGLVGVFIGSRLCKHQDAPLSSAKSTLALIAVAILLAAISSPLLYMALVRDLSNYNDPSVMVLFIAWIASGFFWGIFVELLYRLIRYRRPNTSLEPTAISTGSSANAGDDSSRRGSALGR